MKNKFEQKLEDNIQRYKQTISELNLPNAPDVSSMPLLEGEQALKSFLTQNSEAGITAKQAAENDTPMSRDVAMAGAPAMTAAERQSIVDQLKEGFEAERQSFYKEMDEKIKELSRAASEAGKPSDRTSLLQDPTFRTMMDQLVNKTTTDTGLIRNNYVDPADRMETPVTFFVNKSGILLYHRTEGGKRFAPPDGISSPIKFRKMWRDVDVQTLKATYRGYILVESHALAEWLRKHEDFGTLFFESQNEADRENNNVEWTNSYNRYMTIMKNRAEHEVVKQMRLLDMPVNVNMEGARMRELVSAQLADNEFALRNEARLEKLRAIKAEELLATQGAAVAAR